MPGSALLSRAVGGLCAPRSPWPLALLRVAVCLIILVSPEPWQARELAAGPPELWLAPAGFGWFLPIFARVAPQLWLVHRLLQASALLALVGLWTRASLTLLALSFCILFGGAQLSGSVLHDMHLLWFILLLLVSPAAQVLSLDAWTKGDGWRSTEPSFAAALGCLFSRLLLGMVYFFPGLHKLLDSGIAWASSENLRNQLWLKWFQAGGELPWPRIDLWPRALAAGGVAVLVFELGFLPCLLSRRGRCVAPAVGLAFHALTQHFLYIPFPSLWVCYVIAWDGPRGAQAVGSAAAVNGVVRSGDRAPLPLLLVGCCLLIAVASQGLRGETQAWPFACYPTFSRQAADAIADLAVEVQPTAGELRVLRTGPLPAAPGAPLGARRTPAEWSQVWTLAGLYGAPVSGARLLAFANQLAQRPPGAAAIAAGSWLRFYRESYATDPAAYGRAPVSRVLIHQAREQGRDRGL